LPQKYCWNLIYTEKIFGIHNMRWICSAVERLLLEVKVSSDRQVRQLATRIDGVIQHNTGFVTVNAVRTQFSTYSHFIFLSEKSPSGKRQSIVGPKVRNGDVTGGRLSMPARSTWASWFKYGPPDPGIRPTLNYSEWTFTKLTTYKHQ
jgi:hypothetical protein